MNRLRAALLCAAALTGCDRESGPRTITADEEGVVSRVRVEAVLGDALDRLTVLTDSLDALLRPVPLLTPAQEAVFRRFGNAQQLQRARTLGLRAADAAELDAALRDGRLVELEDSTRLWVVRKLDFSDAFVTPDARALLVEIGERFHTRLEAIGLPPFRLEVTSVLRTAAHQAALRRVNPNAALGESTHEYGTTLDVVYASYAAPAELPPDATPADMAWLAPHVERIAAALLETLAARNSRELQAILGHVMADVQAEGLAMVTLERLQPVYHVTVARRLGS